MNATTLISGDKVVTYEERHTLKAIETKTPDKWIFFDLENGRFYRWDVRLKQWSQPPRRATAVIKKMITALKKEARNADVQATKRIGTPRRNRSKG